MNLTTDLPRGIGRVVSHLVSHVVRTLQDS